MTMNNSNPMMYLHRKEESNNVSFRYDKSSSNSKKLSLLASPEFVHHSPDCRNKLETYQAKEEMVAEQTKSLVNLIKIVKTVVSQKTMSNGGKMHNLKFG